MNAHMARFRLAVESDESALRDLAESAISGSAIQTCITFPVGFSRGAAHLGDTVQILTAEREGTLAVTAVRALYEHRINDERVGGGYLGELRIRPKHRSGRLLAEGFQFLRTLHSDRRAGVYSSVINEENEYALELLASNRTSLPYYTDVGRVHVYAIAPVAPEHRKYRSAGGTVHKGSVDILSRLAERINQNRLQFARVFNEKVFLSGRYIGLDSEDIYFTADAQTVTGTLAVWDQRKFRELRVVGYPPLLEAFRAASAMASSLPAPGSVLNIGHAAFLSTTTDEIFADLVVQASLDLPERGLDAFLLSLHERDSRNAVMSELATTRSSLRMFAVSFDKPAMLDERVPYFEIAFV